MSEPAPAPSPTPTPAPIAEPSPAPAAATRPEWLPEPYWDPKANALNTDEFGKHYAEIAGNAAKFAERQAAVPKDETGYKVELKLPETVKVPEGIKFDPAKDPRTPQFLKVAHSLGLDNTQVNSLIALDAQMAIEGHVAETARVAEETKKLGDNAKVRTDAVTNWARGLKDKNEISADEYEEIRATAGSAAGVTALEKLMAKATGTVPGYVPTDPPKPEPKPLVERMFAKRLGVAI